MVQAQEVQHRGVQVVEMDLARDGAEAELVGFSVGVARPSRRRRRATAQ